LKTFSKNEFKNFGKFVRSPFFYKDKTVIKLYDSLKVFYPDFSNKNLTKEFIFSRIYSGKAYNDSLMKYLMSEMFAMGKRFLAYVNYSSNKFNMQFSMLDEFRKRKLDKIFASDFKITSKYLTSVKQANADYYNKNFSLKNLEIEQMISSDRQKLTGQHIIKEGELAVFTFILRFFTQYYEMLVMKNDSDIDFTSSVIYEFHKNFNLGNFVKYLKETDHEEYPVIALYYNLMMAYLKYEDISYYSNFRKLLRQNLPLLNTKQQFDLYTALGSSCIIKDKRGIKGFNEELFEIHKEMLEMDLFTLKGKKYFESAHFRNILLTASNLKKYKWIEKFINENKEKLNAEHKDDVVNFCYGYLNFQLNNFDKALEYLQYVKYDQLTLDVKHLIIKIHFELGYFDLFPNLIDSYRHNNFLNLLKKVYKLRNVSIKDDEEVMFLKKEITATEPVNSKNWLLDKVNEL
jgi:hypothetical protein